MTWPRSQTVQPRATPHCTSLSPPYLARGTHDKCSSNIGSCSSSSCRRKRLPLRGSCNENLGVVECAQRSLQITSEFSSPVASQNWLGKASILTQIPSFQKPPQPSSSASHSLVTCLVHSLARLGINQGQEAHDGREPIWAGAAQLFYEYLLLLHTPLIKLPPGTW